MNFVQQIVISCGLLFTTAKNKEDIRHNKKQEALIKCKEIPLVRTRHTYSDEILFISRAMKFKRYGSQLTLFCFFVGEKKTVTNDRR